jgi:hypothetical protein
MTEGGPSPFRLALLVILLDPDALTDLMLDTLTGEIPGSEMRHADLPS